MKILEKPGTIDMDTLQKNYARLKDLDITSLLVGRRITILVEVYGKRNSKINGKAGLYEISSHTLVKVLEDPRSADFMLDDGYIGAKRDDLVVYKTICVLVRSFLDFRPPSIAEIFDQCSTTDLRTMVAVSVDIESKKDLEESGLTGSFLVNAHLYKKSH